MADIIGSLSLVADAGFGLPPEESMRSCLVATALARHLGLSEPETSDVFYTALLEHVGCSGSAHEAAGAYGDEMGLYAAAVVTDDTLRDELFTMLPRLLRGRPWSDRLRVLAFSLTRGNQFGRTFVASVCEVGQSTTRRLGLSEGVQRGVHDVFEGWNGRGGFQGLKGESVPVQSRVTRLAGIATRFAHIGGPELATETVRRRSGGMLDPTMAELFVANARAILEVADVADPHLALLDAEPSPARTAPASRLSEIAAVFGDVADLKSTYTLGHSSGVAELARTAGHRIGLDATALASLDVAARLHDIGRVGVSDEIWERPGPLTAMQWEQVRLHAYHSERILARSSALRPSATIAGMHHERLDGSGYHRGSTAREQSLGARILAAADAWQAMTQDRAHRPALGPAAAAERIRSDVDAGRLDGDAAAAVVEAAGQPRPRSSITRPAGLSEREVEVLRAVARGLTNREIGESFEISPRTAEHHVQHVYDKIGVSSRAAAAIFALEHGLID
jgi:HD-GYP domain-containing protein (c-di-GMP phosphodiesterase class II)